MKKLLIIMLSFGLALGASAQRGGHISGGGGYHGGGYISRPVVVSPRYYGGFYNPWYGGYGFGLGLGYGFGFGYGLGWSPYWGYPYAPYYQDRYMPSRLALQIEDIKNDYKERISSTKANKSLTGHERRAAVRQLKHDRDAAIIDAKRNFYYNSRRGNGNSNNNNGYNGNGNNNSNGNNGRNNDDGTVNEYKQ